MSKKEYESIMNRGILENSDIVLVTIGIKNSTDTLKMVKNKFSKEQGRDVCRAEAMNIIDAYLRLSM
jgi:hypothetical protein